MNLGRRIKRAEQAEARQNAAFGGATSLRDEPPSPFEEDFGAAFATDLRKHTAELDEEAEVDDDVAVSSDESEAVLSVTTKGSERADITEWTAQSSEAQPDIPLERFGKWIPAGKASQGGTGGRSGHRGAPSNTWIWVSPGHRGRPPTGPTPPGDTYRDQGDHANLLTKKASILFNLLNSGKHAHMTRGLRRTTFPMGEDSGNPLQT